MKGFVSISTILALCLVRWEVWSNKCDKILYKDEVCNTFRCQQIKIISEIWSRGETWTNRTLLPQFVRIPFEKYLIYILNMTWIRLLPCECLEIEKMVFNSFILRFNQNTLQNSLLQFGHSAVLWIIVTHFLVGIFKYREGNWI